MIHYHGTPISGTRHDVAKFLVGRHALVPFPRQDDALLADWPRHLRGVPVWHMHESIDRLGELFDRSAWMLS